MKRINPSEAMVRSSVDCLTSQIQFEWNQLHAGEVCRKKYTITTFFDSDLPMCYNRF